MMKKTFYYLLLGVLALTFTACGDDDDDSGGGKFVWRGDWNDPADPNYKPGGYNPIEGVWKSEGGGKGLVYSRFCG